MFLSSPAGSGSRSTVHAGNHSLGCCPMALSVPCFVSVEKAAPEIVLITAALGLVPYAPNRRATVTRSDPDGQRGLA